MDISFSSKKQEYLYFQKFLVYKALSVSYFTRTSNKHPSLKLLELKWNLLKRLKEGGS